MNEIVQAGRKQKYLYDPSCILYTSLRRIYRRAQAIISQVITETFTPSGNLEDQLHLTRGILLPWEESLLCSLLLVA